MITRKKRSTATPLRLLLADDHDVVRSGLRAILEGHSDLSIVAEARNGREAVRLYREHHPDVAMLDLRMPELDGLGCIREIRNFDPNARILVLTTYDSFDDIDESMRAGAAAYLLKDVAESELVDCTRKVSRGEQCVSSGVATKLAERGRSVQLTVRELEVLRLICQGKANKEIADVLFISERTVKLHINNLFQKLGVASRTEAMRVGLQRGLIRIS